MLAAHIQYKCLISESYITQFIKRTHFRTFGVRGSFLDVRGSDVRGAFFGRSGFIFGRSGFGVHFRTFGVRTLGGPFSDVRGSGFIFRRSGLGVNWYMIHFRTFGVQWNMVYFRTFGVLMFGVQPRTSENQKHQKPRMSEKKTEPPTSETPNIRNPEPPTPKIRTPNVSNPECPSGISCDIFSYLEEFRGD